MKYNFHQGLHDWHGPNVVPRRHPEVAPPQVAPPQVDPYERARRLRFDSDNPALAGNWTYQAPLGSGSFGAATLWVKLDDAANVIQRVAVKDTELGDKYWDQARYWYGGHVSGVPLEVTIVGGLNRLEDSGNIIHYFGYDTFEDIKVYR